jgi:hypothetical protein
VINQKSRQQAVRAVIVSSFGLGLVWFGLVGFSIDASLGLVRLEVGFSLNASLVWFGLVWFGSVRFGGV